MPIYEYECPVCGRFEHIQRANDKDLRECPTCKDKGKPSKVKRLVSASSFHLKGGGWYKTDYGGSSTSTASSAKKDSSKAESVTGDKPAKTDAKKAHGGGCGNACGCAR